ncbi:hypothetical protein ACHAWF_017842 [Thalassiosira exigua]
MLFWPTEVGFVTTVVMERYVPPVTLWLVQMQKNVQQDNPNDTHRNLLSHSSLRPGSKASQQARRNSVQAVISLVLERHREYRRRDANWLRGGVEGALLALCAGEGRGGSGSDRKRRASAPAVPLGGGSNNPRLPTGESDGGPRSPSKRKRIDAIGSVEVDEKIVVEDDGSSSNDSSSNSISEPRKLAQSNSGGMLNASLRTRYKDVQREREKEAASGTAADDDEGDGSIDEPASAVVKGSGAGDEERPSLPPPNAVDDAVGGEPVSAVLASSTRNHPPAATSAASKDVATPKRKKKSKKTPSRSSSDLPRRVRDRDDDSPYSTNLSMLQPTPRPMERYSDLGGVSPLLQQLRELIEYPLSHPELFLHLGVEPPRGVLLRGPPGCGKTHLARAIAGELNVSYFQVSAPELVGGVSGESEARVRALFEGARDAAPSIVFIDEIDAIAPKRGSGSGGGGGGRGMEQRIVAQLLTSMDGVGPQNSRGGSAVLVLGATNRPDAVDPALRRAGRFDREILLGAPDEKAREGILRVMTRDMRVDDLDIKSLARKTPGFVGADVRSLTKEAAVIAINRIFRSGLLGGTVREKRLELGAEEGVVEVSNSEGKSDQSDATSNDIRCIPPLTPEQLQPLHVTMKDFLEAIPHVQPSSKREGFATVPDVSWSDVGALANIREELTLSVLEPISHPERFEALGLPLPAGVLLYGPPGCGKTLLAKAIANESGANFISVKGPELLDKYVGESERSVRVVFERARSSSPCIIFFDELDSLCPKRGSDGGGGGGVSERVVNQLLTEMDGLDSRRSVFVIAATNRPELIDPAMLRPGRLDKLLYVSLPSPDDRHAIMRALSSKIKLAPDVDLRAIAHDPHANGFSGADCAALLREAGLAVLRDGVLSRTQPQQTEMEEGKGGSPMQITAHHFQYAFEHVLPSVSKKDQARYDRLRDRMARARTRGGAGSANGGTGDASDVENLASSHEGQDSHK